MPQLISKTEIAVEWTDLNNWSQVLQPQSAHVRSPGVHISGIIRAIMLKLGKLKPEDESDEMPLRMAIGMAWENWVIGLAQAKRDWKIEWQPGEWEYDGVFGTPDGIGEVTRYTAEIQKGGGVKKGSQTYRCLDEFKATWKSEHTRKNIVDESLWIWQLAASCYVLGLEHARLHVLWVNGDYRPPAPKYFVYLVKFEWAYLERFWRDVVLVNKGIAVGEKGQGQQIK